MKIIRFFSNIDNAILLGVWLVSIFVTIVGGINFDSVLYDLQNESDILALIFIYMAIVIPPGYVIGLPFYLKSEWKKFEL